jgi:hypothetical protein
LLRRVWDRVNRDNEHFMACIVGREGSGKSYTAIKIADTLDSTFSADRVIFDVKQLLEVLRDGEHDPGNFYVLDEAGVSMGVRTWQDRAQVLANQALQLIRSHNLGLIFTLPRLSELDSQAQGRLQAVLEITDKRPEEHVRLKWKWIDPDRVNSNGNILKKYPRRIQDGYEKRIKRNTFSPPRADLVKPYEDEKSEFQAKFYDKAITKLEEAEADEDEADQQDPEDIATEIADGSLERYVDQHSTTKQAYINKDLIRSDYGLTHSEAKAVKSLLNRACDELPTPENNA